MVDVRQTKRLLAIDSVEAAKNFHFGNKCIFKKVQQTTRTHPRAAPAEGRCRERLIYSGFLKSDPDLRHPLPTLIFCEFMRQIPILRRTVHGAN